MLRSTGILSRWAWLVVVPVMVSACGSGTSPPVTESETGRIVDQPATIEDLLIAVSGEGVVTFAVFGTVPSSCHEAVIGFEEPNADGRLVGSAESWLDPNCSVTDESARFRVTVQIPGLANGEYTVRLPGFGERDFALPNVGRVDGPVLVSPLPESDVLDGMTAEVAGPVRFDSDTGCLLLEHGSVRYPLVWPTGTSWRSNPAGVRLEDGQVVEPGMTVYGGGGYLDRGGIERMAGTEVADAANACAGPTGEIAIFNIGSEVTMTSG